MVVTVFFKILPVAFCEHTLVHILVDTYVTSVSVWYGSRRT